MQETIMEDNLRHHQPIYWVVGLGDRNLGKAVLSRVTYILAFPFWLAGKAILKTVDALK